MTPKSPPKRPRPTPKRLPFTLKPPRTPKSPFLAPKRADLDPNAAHLRVPSSTVRTHSLNTSAKGSSSWQLCAFGAKKADFGQSQLFWDPPPLEPPPQLWVKKGDFGVVSVQIGVGGSPPLARVWCRGTARTAEKWGKKGGNGGKTNLKSSCLLKWGRGVVLGRKMGKLGKNPKPCLYFPLKRDFLGRFEEEFDRDERNPNPIFHLKTWEIWGHCKRKRGLLGKIPNPVFS